MPAPVSVVIPAYNHAAYIVAAIESVLAQTTPPREVIVVDDGSPDDTAARVTPLAEAGRVRYVRQENAGMAAARNAGARLATSEYLYFLDDDDLLFPDAVRPLVRELTEHREAAFAYGNMVVFDDRPPCPGPRSGAHRDPSRAVNPTEFLLFNQIGSPGQVLMRRQAFLDVGGFNLKIWGTDDWDLWLRLLRDRSARMISSPVIAYRLHANNASRDIARMYRSSLAVARRHLAEVPIERRPVLRRYSYARLRRYHAPRIARTLADDLRRGAWRRAAAAVGAWGLAWASDGAAHLALKAHLLRRGRWRLPVDEPVFDIHALDG